MVSCWDVVLDQYNAVTWNYDYERTMCLEDWNDTPEWVKVKDKMRSREWNTDRTINDSNVDIYGPTIKQEFAYMFLDDERMPLMRGNGSDVLITQPTHTGVLIASMRMAMACVMRLEWRARQRLDWT